MSETILVRGARQLLTVREGARDLGVIADGSLLIRGGFIVQAGPTRRVENLAAARQAREIEAAGRVVMPGFVDCDAALGCARPGERATRLAARARATAAIMLRHGTTTMGVRAAEVRILRALAKLDEGPWNIVPVYTGDAEKLPRLWRRKFLHFADTAVDGVLATRGETESMQGVVSLACLRQGLPPEEALRAATLSAAHALRFAERVGSLEPGKQADLLLLNCSDYRQIPSRVGVNHVHLTMKLGKIVYQEGSAGEWPEP
ncbi:MAG: amidohydrolase family protein [Acidobacteria bacterium]|nr:amidohydrolase family protein [Acidobacteriota bacterium]